MYRLDICNEEVSGGVLAKKNKKLYTAFMDLEKAYDRVGREALWSVLYIYIVGGQLLTGIQAFYREVNACLRGVQ